MRDYTRKTGEQTFTDNTSKNQEISLCLETEEKIDLINAFVPTCGLTLSLNQQGGSFQLAPLLAC